MASRALRWLFTCEHATRHVPPAYRPLFSKAGSVLASHRGWDPGALEVFHALGPDRADLALEGRATRLLVDLNRSLHHPRLFSEFTRKLPEIDRRAIIAAWWRPFRDAAEDAVARWLHDNHCVIHLSVHSFTPVLDGRSRAADFGLLYDPARQAERRFADAWGRRLRARGWNVRMNYPYRGVSDGHATALRRRHRDRYAGVELELNQGLFGAAGRRRVLADLQAALGEVDAVTVFTDPAGRADPATEGPA
ncbi:MAG: N-formylglutamate amidohydrolase [Gammaproteobacteria bacterium]